MLVIKKGKFVLFIWNKHMTHVCNKNNQSIAQVRGLTFFLKKLAIKPIIYNK